MLQCICAEFVPIATVVVNEGSYLLESLDCDGMLEGGVRGVGVEGIPVITIVADKVGDCAEGLKWYGGVLEGHGFVRRRERPVAFYERKFEDCEGRRGGVKVFWRWFLLGVKSGVWYEQLSVHFVFSLSCLTFSHM